MDPLTEALLNVHHSLDEHQVKHALCGGVAANLYRAEPRATNDVDWYIVVSPTQLLSLSRAFEAGGWEAHPYWRQGELLRLDHPDLVRVDCLIAGTDIETAAVEDAVTATIEGVPVPVLRPESLIVFKLVAGRFRDFEAVAAIINTHRDALDEEYILETLEHCGVAARWQQALDGAKLEAQDRG